MVEKLQLLKDQVYKRIAELDVEGWRTEEPVPFDDRFTGTYITPKLGESWGKLWDCAWLHFTGKAPYDCKEKHLVFILDIGGEGCIFDDDGVPVRGITNVKSEFSRELGSPGKRIVQFRVSADGNDPVDFWCEAGCNDLFGKYNGGGEITEKYIAVCRDDVRNLYYDLEFLMNFANNTQDEARKTEVTEVCAAAFDALDAEYSPASVTKAKRLTEAELSKTNDDDAFSATAVGHAHMDLAWLWPIRETKRKCARTFSTMNALMDRYPEYIFGVSQPQQLVWVKENYPALYEKMKERFRQGRLELQGGFWVECDTNLTGAEALIRQIIYGKNFFKEEFDYEQEILWLPDVFGYSAQIPQIMKKAGLDYFMTIKMSWNRVNKIPHHTFKWRALDGTEVLVHMPPEGTYNSPANPWSLLKAQRDFLDKDVSKDMLVLFGIGDGGGGPSTEHLESLKRAKDFKGLPKVHQAPAIEFFHKIDRDYDQYATWVGELYLEKHQGTYTTQGRNKRYNRLMEQTLRDAEMLCAFAHRICGADYPKEEFDAIWKEIMLYQFHDIIPGSSIKRVYDESLERYETLHRETMDLLNTALDVLSAKSGAGRKVYFNTLSTGRTACLPDGSRVHAEPFAFAKAYADDQAVFVTDHVLENEYVKVTVGQNGTVTSVYDKKLKREALRSTGNMLTVYDDDADAWEVPDDFAQNTHEPMVLTDSKTAAIGSMVKMTNTFTYGSSTLVQEIVLTADSPRVDFVTNVDWSETHKMLRTAFPTTVKSLTADCEVQFGNVKRPTHTNTSWDKAKIEVCAHKWVDISERDYGVALLNDCKYGYRVWDNTIDINLLRSSTYPGEEADHGHHTFTYSLMIHPGDYFEGGVIDEAYRLNIPVRELNTKHTHRSGEITGSLMSVSAPNIVVEAVKQSENGKGITVRLYEAAGAQTEFEFCVSKIFDFSAAAITDLLETSGEFVPFENGVAKLGAKPFEIITLVLE